MTHDFFTQNMLDLFGILMNVIGGIARLVGQVEFPKAVVTNNLTGSFPTGGSKGESLASWE